MYSVVLAAMMTTSASAPDTWFKHCCPPPRVHACCGGCYGCYGYVAYKPVYYVPYSCCGGCYGCYGSVVVNYSCCGGCYGSAPAPVAKPAAPAAKPQAQPAPALPSPKQGAASSNGATVTFKAPVNVKISIEGQVIVRKSSEESFSTPALDADKSYSYVVEATREENGNKMTLSKKVPVKAGENVIVEFPEFNSTATAAR